MCRARAKPAMIVSDNGTEFSSKALLVPLDPKVGSLALHRARQAHEERLVESFKGLWIFSIELHEQTVDVLIATSALKLGGHIANS